MPKFEDNLGTLIDTALQPVDDDPGFDNKGSTALLAPETDDASEETEDDAAFQGLREAGLSPGEAQREVDTMRPLDEEEADILATTPGLKGLTRVDDPEHQQWLRAVAKEDSKGMDRVLDDATYGETTTNRSEERMEREDVDSIGSWWKKALGHLNPVSQLKSGFKIATYPMRKLGSLAMHFVPGRDAGKATIVRNTYKKLWYEHANWLAQQDLAAGLPLKPRANYEYVAKLWAKDQLTQYKLPISMATDSSGESPASRKAQLDHMILGSNGMGAWFWPFSWFQKSSTTVINNTADKRADTPPEGQQDASAPQYQNVQPPMDDGSSQMPASYGPPSNYGPPPGYSSPSDYGPSPGYGPPPGYDVSPDSNQGVHMHGWNGFIKTRLAGVFGPDALGAHVSQILGHDSGAAQPAKDNLHAERIVKMIALKLKMGKPIGPGELGLLSSAAKEGNVSAQQVIAVLKARGAVVSGDSSGLDPWMYKLNPSYWFASSKKKEFITAEKKGWKENAALQKQLAKQQVDLDAAEKAAQAEQAVEASKAQAAASEARLKEIQATLKGQISGSFVGHEKITTISQVVVNALDKAGKKESAGRLYGKIKSGQTLDKGELQEARQIAKIIGRMKVVHGDLINVSDEALTMHGAFVGACVLGAIDAARAQNDRDYKFATHMSQKIAQNQPVTRPERQALIQTLKSQTALRGFTKSLVSGRAFVGCKQAKTWTKGAFVGAAKAMTDEDKKMLAVIVKLAKVGNPRAQKALIALRQSGEIAGDSMGLGVGKFFHYATAPIWLPAKGIYKGEEALFGQKGGGSSPEQQRLSMMAAAAKRRQAAEARAAAADAQTESEQRAQLAIAEAADAEAAAKDAEALAKEEAMKTKEVQADPSSLVKDDESGEFCGSWVGFVGKGTKDAKIVVAANQNTPTGIKIRAGNRLYKKAKAGDPKSIAAIQAMTAKANAGDPQALRDVNAIKAGKAFQAAQKRAQRKQAAVAARAQRKKAALANREARRLKVVAFQKAYESRIANKMCRMSRTRELKKHWKVERMAAAGNPKAQAYVKQQVALSKKGDKRAKAHVQAMQQGRLIRQKVRTPRDVRNMKEAERFARRLARNDPKTLREYEILKAAANKGNPNAIRAIDRIKLAAMVLSTINTGVVATTHKGKKGAKRDAAIRSAQKQVATAQKKAATHTGSREELAAGAKAAHALGDNATAGQLAQQAATAPSATETIKKKAAMRAAAEADNPEAKAELTANLTDAKKGGVGGIKEIGKLMAVDTADKIEKGEPLPQTMKDAVSLNERIKAGDPVATQQAKEITEQATSPNPSPEATLAAGALVGAQLMDKSLAAKPKAKAELLAQVEPPFPEAEKSAATAELKETLDKTNAGTVTPIEAQRGIAIAMRMGQPKVAAMISAKAPPPEENEYPLSSLPDRPLPPITGPLSLLKASLKALTFTTRNPIANYREGVASRGGIPIESLPTVMGWSAFDSFAKKISLPGLAMASLPVMAITSVTSLFKKPKEQKIVVQMAPPPATPAAPAAVATAKAAGMGADNFQDLVAKALKSKKMSKDDFNKAVKMNLPSNADDATKKASGVQLLDYLKSKNVTVG